MKIRVYQTYDALLITGNCGLYWHSKIELYSTYQCLNESCHLNKNVNDIKTTRSHTFTFAPKRLRVDISTVCYIALQQLYVWHDFKYKDSFSIIMSYR